jgi:two-component system sensor histidine kinase ChvG
MRGERIRRPGIVAKLLPLSLALLAIPWLATQLVRRMDAFVRQGQASAVQLAAEAVATVLHDREDLFSVKGGLPVPLQECSPLPLEAPIQLDGNPRDWSHLRERSCHFGRAEVLESDGGTPTGAASFDLALGERDGYLYALFQITDDAVRYRQLRYRNLDGSDHLRIALPAGGGREHRYLITAEAAGPITTYEVGPSWRYALGDGRPVREVRGYWAESARGYTVELRLPLALLPEKKVGFAVADVDETAGPVASLVGTVPAGGPGRIDPVSLPSPGMVHIMSALDLPGARITVIDEWEHVRTQVGAEIRPLEEADRDRLVRGALDQRAGMPYAVAPVSGEHVTAASWPIRAGERVIGAVLIEQPNQEILGLQRGALERTLAAIVFACLAIAGVLWLFAWRLAWRIHRLRDEAGDAIDADGRVRSVEVAAGRRAGDEIGDLSRTVSGLLARLARYTSFLERIPRTLRHELSNPLNSVSTSLQNLVSERPDLVDSKYVQSAERGVARIGEIVQGLTEAASLEQALRDDEPELLDLSALVSRYVENVAAGCPQRRFSLRGAREPVAISGSGFRIEQLLDKLVDNAVAFSPADSEIAVELGVSGGRALLSVRNDGPPIPEEIRERLFESMVSTRGSGSVDRPHLGIGLYVVRLIVEHLGGSIEAREGPDGSGAVFVVELPLAKPTPAAEEVQNPSFG